jgi:hypothetical protein
VILFGTGSASDGMSRRRHGASPEGAQRGGIFRGRPRGTTGGRQVPGHDSAAGDRAAGAGVRKLAGPPAVVVVLATVDAAQYVLRALRAGAAGFLVKPTPPEDLIGLVQVAAEG